MAFGVFLLPLLRRFLADLFWIVPTNCSLKSALSPYFSTAAACQQVMKKRDKGGRSRPGSFFLRLMEWTVMDFHIGILQGMSDADGHADRAADDPEHAEKTDDAAAVYLFHFVQVQFFHAGIHCLFLLSHL